MHGAKSNCGMKRSNGRFAFKLPIALFAIIFNCSRFSHSRCNRRSVLPKPSEQVEQLTRIGGPLRNAAEFFRSFIYAVIGIFLTGTRLDATLQRGQVTFIESGGP